MNIGITIRKIRKRKKLSQKELSRISNISQTYISQIESGEKNPSIAIIEKIGDVLNVPFQIISFLSLDNDISSIPESKQESYKQIEPAVKAMIEEFFFTE